MREPRRVKILQIANRHAPFPVEGYGGIERVVAMLHETLPAIGSVGISGSTGERVVTSNRASVESLIETARDLVEGVDMVLVHHPEMVEPACKQFGEDRVSEMLHVPIEDASRFKDSKHLIIGISHDQVSDVRILRPDVRVCWHATPEAHIGDGLGGYVAWVGRFMPEKGPVEAIMAARKAGVPLRLAGLATGGSEHGYFDEHIKPLLGGDIEWVGPVDSSERDELLRGAAALLVPTQWREAFGLTAIEAAMVGTPVLGFPVGATREIIEAGVGEICYGVNHMAQIAQKAVLGEIDRGVIGTKAREIFTPAVQATNLKNIFEKWVSR